MSLLWLRLLLWCRFDPWPWNFHVPCWGQAKKERTKEGERTEGRTGGRKKEKFKEFPLWLKKKKKNSFGKAEDQEETRQFRKRISA